MGWAKRLATVVVQGALVSGCQRRSRRHRCALRIDSPHHRSQRPGAHQGRGEFDCRVGPLLQYSAEERPDVLTFTSEVLEQPLAIMGPVTARIWIRPDTPIWT